MTTSAKPYTDARGLKVSKELELPAESVTHSFGLLAMRGAGKTNAARVLAEEMYDAGLPFVAIDPVGSWWGLRAGRDGKKAGGLAIPIFGGRHADLPLHRGAGVRITLTEAAKRAGYAPDSGGVRNAAGRLRTLELVHGGNAGMQADRRLV